MLSATTDEEHIQAAMKRGASGFILKNVDPADLASALRLMVEGTAFNAVGAPALERDEIGKAAGLTERETEILRSVAKGMTTQTISRELWVSVPTVKFHLRNVYRKLGVNNRTGAARWAYENGLVSAVRDADPPPLSLSEAR
jgi:DNA-binding NarL/FixJ family response regulator